MINIKKKFEYELKAKEKSIETANYILSVIQNDLTLFREEMFSVIPITELKENIKKKDTLKNILNSDFFKYKYFRHEVTNEGIMEIIQPKESFDIKKMNLIASLTVLEIDYVFNYRTINCLLSILFDYTEDMFCERKCSLFVYENVLYININISDNNYYDCNFNNYRDCYLILPFNDFLSEIINEAKINLDLSEKKIEILDKDKSNNFYLNKWKKGIAKQIDDLESIINSFSKLKNIKTI